MKKTLLFMLLLLSCSKPLSIKTTTLLSKQEMSMIKMELKEALSGESGINSFENPGPYVEDIRDKLSKLREEDINELLVYEISLAVIDTTDIPGVASPALLLVPKGGVNRCATSDPKPKTANKAFTARSVYSAEFLTKPYDVPLIFHIIQENEEDVITDLSNQVQLLNMAFEPLKLHFFIQEVTKTLNPTWYHAWPDRNNEALEDLTKEMTNSLHVEQENAINIYINMPEVLGISRFPWDDVYRTPLDNIIISRNSLPGYYSGPIKMEGKTLVHEMGHFLGLFHTFHDPSFLGECNDTAYNGCKGVGDRVPDTPPQKICLYRDGFCDSSMNECPDTQGCDECDTCLGDKKKDAVNNYMGYNYDSKMTEFTQNQIERMRTQLYLGDRQYLIKKYLKI